MHGFDKRYTNAEKMNNLSINTIRMHYYISDNEIENVVSNVIVETY